MISRIRILMILAALPCIPAALMAQTLGSAPMGPTPVSAASGAPEVNAMNPYSLLQKHWIVSGKVMTLDGNPVAGAKVIVQPTVEAETRVLTTNVQGQFDTEYDLNVDMVKEFSVAVTANKKGYLKTHALIDFGIGEKPFGIPITLRDPKSGS